MRDILDYLQNHTVDILADIETLVRIESPSKYADGINRVQAVTRDWLHQLGEVNSYSSGLGEVVHARIPGQREQRIVLLAHVDTVYPVGAWQEVWSVKDEQAFGPGTYDMKAGAVQAMWALRAIQSVRGRPTWTVDFLLTPDVEIGSEVGRPFIEDLAHGAKAVLVLEPPFMNGDLKIARKGVGEYLIQVHGKAAHQGVEPEKGRNAIVSAAHLITEIVRLQDLKIARKGVGEYLIQVHGKAAHQGVEPEKGRNAIVSAAHLITEIVRLQDL